ncbi:hypothetical protein [Salinarimonas ramus]|uniref:Uncharacterized protein n=1 Tax=Salinarimonas ramus TaxID=690164 RepID=A0A917QH19_9HYPH|nr:hypothetical protein [Salinarimonas ramus]GGK50333.1 hypothetical protein GCM10011322_41660 [Salinarimonas ramus]
MPRLAALLLATYVGAFVLTSALAAPHELRATWDRIAGTVAGTVAALSAGPAEAREPAHGVVATKTSARMRLPQPASASRAAEIVAFSSGAIGAFDVDGRLVALHDPDARTTTVVRGAEVPRLLVAPAADEPRLPIRPAPADAEPVPDADEPLAAGCESPVSPLARTRAVSSRTLCLASL